MRISIREQLALLVLITSGIALAILAIATWETENNFVTDVAKSSLSLTASLKAAQISSNLLLIQASVSTITTRFLLQAALKTYNDGEAIDDDWTSSKLDLQAALSGGGSNALLLQARVYPKNSTGDVATYGLLNVTSLGITNSIALPYTNKTGGQVYLGDDGYGYPPSLYPNLTYSTRAVNSTFNVSEASYGGKNITSGSALLLGPLELNQSFALMSLTRPIINNTSSVDVLAYLTTVFSTAQINDIITSPEGLQTTGETLICGPNNPTNMFVYGQHINDDTLVDFVFSPEQNTTRSLRHSARAFGNEHLPFAISSFPAVEASYTHNTTIYKNAGSLFSTHNEQGKSVSVGFSSVSSESANWTLIVELAHREVVLPIIRLRNLILICVFGTLGGLLLAVLPIAHFSVGPLRRLRDATTKTAKPFKTSSEDGSCHSRDDSEARYAKKKGFFRNIFHWQHHHERGPRQTESSVHHDFRIPTRVPDKKHFIHDELTDLTGTFNEMTEELIMQYERLEERVRERTRELEQSKKAAEAANESKTLFIANISHELKTPLNGILGLASVSMEERDITKIQRALGIIYKSGDLLLHLLNDLLTFSKNEIGRQVRLEEKEFRLIDISSQILSIFEKQAKDAKIDLDVIFLGPDITHDSTPLAAEVPFGPDGTCLVRDMCVWGDQYRILQVIINLVSNSLKFTSEGGSVEVRIKCLGETDAAASRSRDNSANARQSQNYSMASSVADRNRHGSEAGTSRGASTLPASSSSIGHDEPKRTSVTLCERPHSPPTPPSSPPLPSSMKELVFSFEVQDTGKGIPEDQQQRIFEPFVQGDLGLNKKYGGTGLGLSICTQLARLLGGRLSIESEEGVGSTFSMQIPLQFTREKSASTANSSLDGLSRSSSESRISASPSFSESHTPGSYHSCVDSPLDAAENSIELKRAVSPRLADHPQAHFSNHKSSMASKRKVKKAIHRVARAKARFGDKVRVLIADDNNVNREVVTRMLVLEDVYDVSVARDGQEAYDLVKTNMADNRRFDLIFMDIQMPNVDGIQCTRLIRSIGYSAPIVALTAYTEEISVDACIESGMNEFLCKPIHRQSLRRVLKKFCVPIPEIDESELSSSKPALLRRQKQKPKTRQDGEEQKEQEQEQKQDS